MPLRKNVPEDYAVEEGTVLCAFTSSTTTLKSELIRHKTRQVIVRAITPRWSNSACKTDENIATIRLSTKSRRPGGYNAYIEIPMNSVALARANTEKHIALLPSRFIYRNAYGGETIMVFKERPARKTSSGK